MFKFIVILSAFVIAFTGCNVQRGRFVTFGDEYHAFSSPGGLVIVKGSPTTFLVGGAAGPPKNLLYILFISPNYPQSDNSGSIAFGKYSTTFFHTLNNRTNDIPVSVEWDRRSDSVQVQDQKFARAKGNIFIVRLDANANVVCRQIASLGPNGSPQQVLALVHQKLPNDKELEKLTFITTR